MKELPLGNNPSRKFAHPYGYPSQLLDITLMMTVVTIGWIRSETVHIVS